MKISFLFSVLILLPFVVFSQPLWINISDTRDVNKIIHDGDKIWLSSRGGLMCIDKVNQDTIFYNHAKGMPFTEVMDMCLDKTGKLWLVCDQKGIACKDGDNWIHYDTMNTDLPNNFAVSVTVDSQNNKWFGFNHYLVKFDGSNWTSYSIDTISTWFYIPYNIAVDKDDRILIGANGIWAFDGNTFIHYDTINSPLPDENIYCMKSFPDGKVWIAHSLHGVTVTDFTTWQVIDTIIPGKRLDKVTSFDCTTGGDCWLGTLEGDLYYLHDSVWTQQLILPPVDSLFLIKYLAVDESNVLYVSADNPAKFDGTSWYRLDFSESEYRGYGINDFCHTPDSSTWIANMYGLFKHWNNSWTLYNQIEDSIYLSANNLTIDQNGKLYGLFNNKIGYFENNIWYTFPIPQDPQFVGCATDICFDKEGNLWIANYPGLIRINSTDTTFYSFYYNNFPGLEVRCLNTDSEGRIIVGSILGYHAWNGTTWTTYNISNSPLPSNNVWDITVTENKIWIATSEGLAMIDGSFWNIYTPDNSPLPHHSVRTISHDNNNVVWMISGIDNLVRFDGQNWEVIDYYHSGILNGNMSKISVDLKNNIWIGGLNNGISIYNENGVILQEDEFPEKSASEKELFTVYPNPCRESFRISCHFPLKSGKYQLTLSDICGKILADYPLKSQDQLFQMDGFIETRGTYLVSVQDENGMIIESKILISR